MANVGNNGSPTVGSVEGAGGVVDSGNGGSEGLGLGGSPVLSLVRLGHRLVGHLSGSTVHGGSMDGGMDHRSGMDHGSGVDHGSSMVDRTGNGNGEGNGVRSSPGGGAVVSLRSLEVGAGVVVGNSV